MFNIPIRFSFEVVLESLFYQKCNSLTIFNEYNSSIKYKYCLSVLFSVVLRARFNRFNQFSCEKCVYEYLLNQKIGTWLETG